MAKSVATSANTYYVSPTGNDRNPGTIDRPFKTIQHAIDQTEGNGGTVFLRDGVYQPDRGIRVRSGQDGTSVSPLVIRSYPGENAIIDGSRLSRGTIGIFMKDVEHVDLRDLEIRSMPNRGVQVVNGKHVNILDNVIHDTQYQGISVRGYLAHIEGDTTQRSQNIRIEGNEVFHTNLRNKGANGKNNWGEAIQARYSDDVVISDNNVYENYGHAIGLVVVSDAVVRNNDIRDSFSVNLYLDNASDSVIEGNFIYNSQDERFYRNGKPAPGISLANEVYEVKNPSKYYLNNNTIRNNIVVDTKGIQYGTWAGIHSNSNRSTQGLRNTLIANNTFYSSRTDEMLKIGADPNNSNVKVANNIFYNADGRSNDALAEVPSTKGVVFDRNLWYGGKAGSAFSSSDVTTAPPMMKPGGSRASDYQLQSGFSGTDKRNDQDGFRASSTGDRALEIGAYEFDTIRSNGGRSPLPPPANSSARNTPDTESLDNQTPSIGSEPEAPASAPPLPLTPVPLPNPSSSSSADTEPSPPPLSSLGDDSKPGGNPIRVEAEDMTLRGAYEKDPAQFASGQFLIELEGKKGHAVSQFTGEDGRYQVVVGYHDESRGASPVSLIIGDNRMNWTFDQGKGASYATPDNFMSRVVSDGVALKTGDTIRLESTRDRAENAKVDFIEFIPVDASTAQGEGAGSISRKSALSPSQAHSQFDVMPKGHSDSMPDTPFVSLPQSDLPVNGNSRSTPIRLEAEEMRLQGAYEKDSAKFASGKSLIELEGQKGRATAEFAGETGRYQVVAGYHDESKGVSPVSLSVGDQTFKWLFDAELGATYATPKNFVSRVISQGTMIQSGDLIALEAHTDGAENAKFDYFQFIPVTGQTVLNADEDAIASRMIMPEQAGQGVMPVEPGVVVPANPIDQESGGIWLGNGAIATDNAMSGGVDMDTPLEKASLGQASDRPHAAVSEHLGLAPTVISDNISVELAGQDTLAA